MSAAKDYIEARIEALTGAGRLDDAAIDRAVAKGLLKAEKAQGIKDKKPKPPKK